MRSGKLSLLVWLVVCAATLGLMLPSFLLPPSTAFVSRDAPIATLSKYWEVHYGPNQPTTDSDWQPFGPAEWSKLERYSGELWVRRDLPELPWRDPHLYIGGMNRFAVSLDGREVYRFHMDDDPVYNHYLMTRHPIRLSPEDEGRKLTIRFEWDRLKFLGDSWIYAGNPNQVFSLFFRADVLRYVYSIICLLAFAIGLALFARRRERLILWFASLAFCAGCGLLFLCVSLQWYVNVGSLYYWKDLLLAFGVYSFVGLYAEVLGAARRLPLRIVKIGLLLYAFACLIAGLNRPTLYWKMLTTGFPWLALLAVGVVTFAIVRYPSEGQSAGERRWLLRGYAVLVAGGLGHILANYAAELNLLSSAYSYSILVLTNVLANGLFLFMLGMTMILVHRVSRVYVESERNARDLLEKNNELEQFHHNLERLVERRTEQLEEANRFLSVTLREKAETLAEVSVLEERNRIAHEMHDVVGHTLTAAIVQLEASKKIAEREDKLPLGKLDTVGGLVRKGLDDIRKTVRRLKNEKIPDKLEDALRELIRETIETMEVEIEAEIVIPLPLGKPAEQVVYHALQEGLTNGIRHAQCSRFRYSLLPVGDALEIRLWNDGKPFADARPGFGLTAMTERIHLLGGALSVRSSENADGEPMGCELAITLPLPEPNAAG
ncbi:sensor histidine kinase [Cohnella cellulosilytica]|uniref:histidine kinase n=1 Tax=Cohnella cellulosilytica TaxID=986710 RepID=A0ABW2FHC6_9BACL